jgi:hypothetical protein
MVKVVIDDKKGLVQESGGGTVIKNRVDLSNNDLLRVGLTSLATTTQTLDAHKNILSCSKANFMVVDAGGSARTGLQLATGSHDGQTLYIANVSNANAEKITLSPNSGSSQVNTLYATEYEIIPLQAGGHVFGPLLWYKNGWMPVSGTTIRLRANMQAS